MNNVYAEFNGGGSNDLPLLCIELLEEQKMRWATLRNGYESLKRMKSRNLQCNGFSVRILHNPGRAVSTLADVAGNAINERPCFLCSGNLPDGQTGILYRDKYLILCNPAPVFPEHFTVSFIEHCPQAIAGSVDAFITLIKDLGPGWVVMYNGPKCGASAPDHLHFQTMPAGRMPVEMEVQEQSRLIRIERYNNVSLYRVQNMGREVMMFNTDNRETAIYAFSRYLDALRRIFSTGGEPMINIIGSYEAGKWRLILFPRSRHRPDMFYGKGDARIAISPAVMEMGGVIVAPFEKDFERIDSDIVKTIYKEVSISISESPC